MRPQDKTGFVALFQALADAFPQGHTIDLRTKAKPYFEDLAELDLDEIVTLFRLARRQLKFFPSIAELRELAGLEAESTPRQARLQQAEQAWRWVSQPQDSRPYNREALVSDSITAAVFKEMGGGYKTEAGFGRWPKEKDEAKQREFIRRYMAHTETPRSELSHAEATNFLKTSGLGDRLGMDSAGCEKSSISSVLTG